MNKRIILNWLMGRKIIRLEFKKNLYDWACKEAERIVGKKHGKLKKKFAVKYVIKQLHLNNNYEKIINCIIEKKFIENKEFINKMIE